jgi:hypothetical protein
MAQKYYNSAETAKILGKTTDEVKEMLERRELHGYRDGADWKFKVEDIDRLAMQSPATGSAADEDVGDVLLSEVALGQSDPGLSGTVIGLNAGARLAVDSDIRLAQSDIALSALTEESTATAAKKKTEKDAKSVKGESSGLSLSDDFKLTDSSVVIGGKAVGGSSSAIDLGGSRNGMDDDDLVLGGSGTGSDVTLGADSGISLIDPSDSGFSLETPVNLGPAAEESLELGEDDMVVTGEGSDKGGAALKTDDEFLLTPLEDTPDLSGSESGSQVIALDTDDSGSMVGESSGVSMAAMLDEDISAQQPLDMGMAAPLVGASVLAAQPTALAEGAALTQTAATLEAPYTGLQIAGLAVCSVVMLLCGMMMYDLLRSMWSFEQPFAITSQLMNTILGWIGL